MRDSRLLSFRTMMRFMESYGLGGGCWIGVLAASSLVSSSVGLIDELAGSAASSCSSCCWGSTLSSCSKGGGDFLFLLVSVMFIWSWRVVGCARLGGRATADTVWWRLVLALVPGSRRNLKVNQNDSEKVSIYTSIAIFVLNL